MCASDGDIINADDDVSDNDIFMTCSTSLGRPHQRWLGGRFGFSTDHRCLCLCSGNTCHICTRLGTGEIQIPKGAFEQRQFQYLCNTNTDTNTKEIVVPRCAAACALPTNFELALKSAT